MRIILLLIMASFGLSGCALLVEAGALEAAGVGEGAAGGAAASVAATDFELSSSLAEDITGRVDSGTREGSLANAFAELTNNGQRTARLGLSQNGTITASGQPIASLDADGNIFAADRKIGFVNAADTRLYQISSNGSTSPIAVIRGFVPENGVQLISQVDGTLIRILRSDVVVDVIAIRNGQYLVRLASGDIGLIPSSAVRNLALLGLVQLIAACPEDGREGAVVRHDGEVIRFKRCERKDNAYVLSTDAGDTIVDAHDVETVLTGSGIPGVQGDGSDQRLVSYAQQSAATAGVQPGEQAMNYLADVAFVPALEQAHYQYGPPHRARNIYRIAAANPIEPHADFAQSGFDGSQSRTVPHQNRVDFAQSRTEDPRATWRENSATSQFRPLIANAERTQPEQNRPSLQQRPSSFGEAPPFRPQGQVPQVTQQQQIFNAPRFVPQQQFNRPNGVARQGQNSRGPPR
jgi:hypothetical protein